MSLEINDLSVLQLLLYGGYKCMPSVSISLVL